MVKVPFRFISSLWHDILIPCGKSVQKHSHLLALAFIQGSGSGLIIALVVGNMVLLYFSFLEIPFYL